MAKAKSKAKPEPKAKPSKSSGNKSQARNDAYTLMLFVTFVAMALGCVMLYLDFDEYAQQKAPTAQPPALQKLGGDDASKGGASSSTPSTNTPNP